ncbi:MAG: SRPBCC family protein [Actinobacteria bacterium]|jgi:ribosome-associated toxin RatA of RatAB toxin-antitoxin module|nr:SRPBCC family protein [Actinomycetota bacterium]
MADQTESSIIIEATPAEVMAVVADLKNYPSWASAIKRVDIDETDESGRPLRVTISIDAGAMRDTVSLVYDWSGSPDVVSWSLEDAKMLTAMDGAYEVRKHPEGSEVSYRLTVDLSMPMLSMIKRKAEKDVVDSALKQLKKFVEEQ